MAAKFEGMNKRSSHKPDVSNGVPNDLQDDIVIAGISARLPRSPNLEEFRKNLFDGVDCVTEEGSRWPPGLYDLPTRSGTVEDIWHFDNSFFGINPKQTSVMDPQIRMLLEVTYEAIVDAGFNPTTLRGKKIGVFVGVSNEEAILLWTSALDKVNGYALLGCIQNMFANRISYTFDFKGPSYAIDSACSSSFSAMHQALRAIRKGECEAAIVASSTFILNPAFSLQYHKLNMLSQDGKCKAFDANADGQVRSDSSVVIFLQKSKYARRIYASVIKSKINGDGYKSEGIISPKGEMQYKLMREVYDETGINPADISYVEANATGIRTADAVEGNTIANIFCKDRKEALLIGSVKSNMGQSDATSGFCSIAKVLIAMENGKIPPNLHYKTPNPDIPALVDGRLRVVDKVTPWNGGLVALNSFSYSGINGHVLLRSNPKPKLSPTQKSKLPKLVAVSGRTTEAVNYMLDAIRNNQQDDEFIALFRDIHAENIVGHIIRGFEVLGNNDSRQVDDCFKPNRPIWFVFSGMGSQWEGMGRHLMCIETFRRSIDRCAAALKPVGIDLMDLIMHGTNDKYYNIANCFVSIAAVQVGLVDLLTFLGIYPDKIVGHSFGEIGCAYADGTLTAEQMVLAAYWRGKAVLDSDSPPGAMAAVGLSWEETMKRCPADVYPVCHNSADSVTISGPIEATENFVKELQEKDIFAKMVNSSGYAFHSRYIETAGPILLSVMEKLIPNPKKRSSKWISSSVPESNWDSPLAQYSSAAYHVNNLLSPVLFHGTTVHVPDNAIAIEIGPHSLLQAILRRSLSPNVTNIGLQRRNHKDNLSFFLESIGKLYVAGGQPKISNLYPTVNYPVGRGTPMINSLIKWDHSIEWPQAEFSFIKRSADYSVDVALSKERDAFLTGHKIDGRIVYPVAGYIMLIWQTFAKLKDRNRESMSVIFENVHFQRAVTIPKDGTVKFLINIFSGNGDFEICESGTIVVTGRIRCTESNEKAEFNLQPLVQTKESELTKEDIYEELRSRGYDYNGIFQGIQSADNRGTTGTINWCKNWISFIDSLFQFCLLGSNTRELYLPTRMQYLSINPAIHMKITSEFSQEDCTLPIYNYKNINCLKSGGVEMRGLRISLEQRRQQIPENLRLERYTFIPYENNQILAENKEKAQLHALNVLLQVVSENLPVSKIKVVEITDNRVPEALLTPQVFEMLYKERKMTTVDSHLITTSPDNYASLVDQFAVKVVADVASAGQDLYLVLAANLITNKSLNALKHLSTMLKNGGFIMLEESGEYDQNLLTETDLKCVVMQRTVHNMYVLLKKIEQKAEPICIQVTEKNFSWLESVKKALKQAEKESQEILLVNQGEEQCGIVGFVNCLRLETGGRSIRYVFIQDHQAPKFSLTEPFYVQQISKQMTSNVLKAGRWGSYRHLSLEQKINTPFQRVEHAIVSPLIPGDLSSLCWIESGLFSSSLQPKKHPNTELCSVYYASVNFKDILTATGKLTPEILPAYMNSKQHSLGLEFSGRDSNGRRVMGLVAEKGLATTVITDSSLLWEVPDKWSLEEAASIPLAYTTSYYALFVWGCLKSIDSVLIHAGSSGVGLASITIALHRGCKVFTTVDSLEKRNFLKKAFPQLTDRNIGNSTDTTFEHLIMNETNGRGVDVILNSLSKEKLQASVRCLAFDGRFLDISNYDVTNVSHIGMSVFLKNIDFNNISLDSLFESNASTKKELVRLVKDGIETGAIRPLPTKTFSEKHISEAFTYMASGQHVEKVLLKIREEEAQKVVPKPSKKIVEAIPRICMNPDKSYVIIGGLERLGLELTNWMIERGAKNILLTSRSGIRTGYQALCLRRWRERGANVVISRSDCTTLADTEELIKQSNKIASVGGIFNLNIVLNNSLIENLSEDNFKTATLPKLNVTRNLDVVSRKSCPYLDYFVVFSSATSGRGRVGQSNYGFADSAMERIVEKRASDALPGFAIQWGTVDDVNSTVGTIENNKIEAGDTLQQRLNNYLSTMDILLRQLHPVLSYVV